MATEPFLINPYRSHRFHSRRRKRNAPRKVEAAIVAPKRRKKSHRGRAKLHLGPMHRPVLYGTGSSWVRSMWSKSKAGGVKLNPRRHPSRRSRHFRHNPGGSLLIAGANPRRKHYRRNPALAIGGFDFLKNAPLILTGALSAASLVIVPNFLKLTSTSPLVKYGVQAGVIAGGGFLAGKALGAQYAYSWMLAGSAVVLADVLQHYVFGTLLPGNINLTQQGFGAFPGYHALSAFPASNPMPAQRYDTLDVYPSAGDDGPY